MVDEEEEMIPASDVSACSTLITLRDLLCTEVLLYLIWLVRHHGEFRMMAEWNSGGGETLNLVFLLGL